MKSLLVEADLTLESPFWQVRFKADGRTGMISLNPVGASAASLMKSAIKGARQLDAMASYLEPSGLSAGVELMGIPLGRAGHGCNPGLFSAMLGYRRLRINPFRVVQVVLRYFSWRDPH